eukprot:TRINITY_DN8540_c0_g1_i1.p1 TRINITY_DN8540_c0_g1~~TRINITY_DN8540_c0_g1_i1.p1  ORF type:complete len:393 (-),score=70.93 TRINITY_DN8540_c0_g1_i1:340-1518(-)
MDRTSKRMKGVRPKNGPTCDLEDKSKREGPSLGTDSTFLNFVDDMKLFDMETENDVLISGWLSKKRDNFSADEVPEKLFAIYFPTEEGGYQKKTLLNSTTATVLETLKIHCANKKVGLESFNVFTKYGEPVTNFENKLLCEIPERIILLNPIIEQRWFVLTETNLSWFMNKQEGEVKGSIDVTRLTGCDLIPETTSFSIKTNDGKQYVITCKEGMEKTRSWVNTLLEVANIPTQLPDTPRLGDKRGSLEKGRKSFFVLYGNCLAWFPNDTTLQEKKDVMVSGCLNLTGAQVSQTGLTVLTLKPHLGIPFTLTAPTQANAEEWRDALVTATHRSVKMEMAQDVENLESMFGWVTKKYFDDRKNHKRYLHVNSKEMILRYYDSELVRIWLTYHY